ncbi:MAG: hypothetical protein HYU54_02545 [Actinobacteria bacterium]|nr:hypothetical protein [Actinomycetota bacterium]
MTATTARRLAWSLCPISVAAIVGSVILAAGGKATFGGFGVAGILSVAAFPVMGAVIASRRPGNPIGWLFCGIGLSFSLASLSGNYALEALIVHPGTLPAGRFMAWVSVWTWPPGITMLMNFLLLLFPAGRLPSRRWRPVAWLAVAALVLEVVPIAITAWPARGPLLTNLGDNCPPGAPASFCLGFKLQVLGILLMFALGLLAAVSLVLRLRRAAGDERAQLKWFAYAGAALVLAIIANSPLFHLGGVLLPVVALLFLPLAAGIAILKYRLYDIDVVINKTLVYGGLVAFITAVYVAIVVGIGTLIGSRDEPSLALSIAATAVVAVAFQPVRERVRHLANRLVYGKRATPYEVMADFSHRMAGTISIEEALPEMAEAAARGVGAVRSRVQLLLPMGGEQSAVWPPDEPGREFSRVIDVYHQGEPVGEIAVAKPLGEPLTPAESKLLEDLASQAGLALHNVRLAEELRARLDEITAQSEALRLSQQRIVTARDVQRRQLEREIREGAQRELMEIGAKLRAATNLVERDTDEAVALLDRLGADANATLAELRDLARGIFPPLLADKGVVAALEAHVRKESIPAALDVDGAREVRFDPEVEAAVFFCCVQALQNARRHAGGVGISLRLAATDGMVEFEVSDEGTGFDPTSTGEGMGFQIMRDRVEALDGTLNVDSSPGRGTTVIGRVPGRMSEGV